MDAVPVTLGQEFAGYAAQIRLGRARVADTLPRVAQIPLGGTATGTGPEHAPAVRRARCAGACAAQTRLKISPPEDPFEAQANRDALVELSGALKVVAVSMTKIAQDLALMGSGPRAGIGELFLPELQKGSSIMPGKVNPVIPEVVLQVAAQVIGNDTGDHDRRHAGQLRAQRAHPADRAQPALVDRAADQRRDRAQREVRRGASRPTARAATRSAEATLAVATALNPYIGYDKATEIVQEATRSGRPLREVAREKGVSEAMLDEALDLRKMALGGEPALPRPRRQGSPPASSRSSSSCAPPLESGSLRLPHFGDCTHEGQPSRQRHSLISRCASATSSSKWAKAIRVMPTPPGWPSWMKIVGPPVCGWALVESPPMSQRSHIASSGSTAICACSAACSEPSSSSGGKPSSDAGVELEPHRLRGEARRRAGRARSGRSRGGRESLRRW